MSGDIVILVEDPGAANFIAGTPGRLAALGHRVRTFAKDWGATQLAALGESFESRSIDIPTLLDNRPSLIVVGTSENSQAEGLALVEAARDRGVRTVGAVDSHTNAADRFRGTGAASLTHAPDYIVAADQRTARAFVNLGFPHRRIAVCGHPLMDRLRDEARGLSLERRASLRKSVHPGAAAHRPLVAFLAERSTRLGDEPLCRTADYTLVGRGGSIRRTDIVLEEVLDAIASFDPRPFLVLRLHPKNCIEEFARYATEVDALSSGVLAWPLLAASDAVIGMTSMILVEAAVLGTPTLSVVPRRVEREWLVTGDVVTPCVTTRDEIGPALAAALTAPPPDPVALETLYPSGATERLAQCIHRLALNDLDPLDAR